MALITLKPAQVATLMNDAVKNTLGDNATILSEDLSEVVDVGTALANANAYKNFLENLMVATAKYIFSFRPYTAKAPNILRDNYEYGQIIQKIRTKLPKSFNNQSWEIQAYASYDDNQYIPNEVEVKLFMKQITFECRKSITNDQIKNAFTNATELGNFVSQQFGYVQNKLQLDLENLTYMVINTAIAKKVNAVKQVKLLTKYKAEVPGADATLTSDKCLFDKGFLIYASATLKDYIRLMQRYSVAYNDENFENFTPEDLQHVVLFSKLVDNMAYYAESSTFHDEFIKLPEGFSFEYLQGLGDGTIKDRTTVDVTLPGGDSIKASYVAGIIFDHDAIAINHDQPSVETHYVKSAQFTNYWYKEKLGSAVDFSENMVVFTLE